MAEISYLVTITYSGGRGVAFALQKALHNSVRVKTSPIRSMKSVGVPSSSSAKFQVTVDDGSTIKLISDAILNSGRMPSGNGTYNIDVELYKEGKGLKTPAKQPEKRPGLEKRLAELQAANAALSSDLAVSRDIKTPLEGILAYFGAVQYKPEILIGDSHEMVFAQRALRKDIPNTFVGYVNHMLNTDMKHDEIMHALAYDVRDGRLNDLKPGYEEAKAELAYLDRLKKGEATDVPPGLRQDYIKVIETKNPGKTIEEYETMVKEQEATRSLADKISALEKKYTALTETLGLLEAGQSIPVIFSAAEGSLEIYFPFPTKGVQGNFVESLGNDLKAYFSAGGQIEPLKHDFVAYRVHKPKDIAGGVDHLVEDVPPTLVMSGFNRIIPCKLG